MIWKYASFQIRIVEIINNVPLPKIDKYPSKSLVPALLHVCRESRIEGLNYYDMLPSYGDKRSYRDTYVNWEVDYVYLSEAKHKGRILEASPPSEHMYELRQKCRHLIMAEEVVRRWRFRSRAFGPSLVLQELFSVLETFTIVKVVRRTMARPVAQWLSWGEYTKIGLYIDEIGVINPSVEMKEGKLGGQTGHRLKPRLSPGIQQIEETKNDVEENKITDIADAETEGRAKTE